MTIQITLTGPDCLRQTHLLAGRLGAESAIEDVTTATRPPEPGTMGAAEASVLVTLGLAAIPALAAVLNAYLTTRASHSVRIRSERADGEVREVEVVGVAPAKMEELLLRVFPLPETPAVEPAAAEPAVVEPVALEPTRE
ncbi:hypothetical protein GCM10010193_04840 [Kitasatospora atroaurantiaca]|uniref:Uncharacterized protein n=1 Tax=Kitasatospora atroaurantiaca TaxID=285545 RepID=A0A561EM76_9ACTN|nr:hypothetical protein [Kitasatospora atroaurantiaca]TWE16700.1 hypothetical protein FB465_1683 [Kitasatospora atroaurantiaca]